MSRKFRSCGTRGDHPQRIGLGIDEGTALVVAGSRAEVVGRSYVLRVESIEGQIRIDAFDEGQTVPLPDP